MVFNHSSLFTSMSNLIEINIHFMDMEKEWDNYKMEILIKNVNKKK
jgi:hypothetical protein